jgi:hypothetical protein
MSRLFVDTLALLAFLLPTDMANAQARKAFRRLQASEAVEMFPVFDFFMTEHKPACPGVPPMKP